VTALWPRGVDEFLTAGEHRPRPRGTPTAQNATPERKV
jgi:hypothetical protein